jgi:hypothetical protein
LWLARKQLFTVVPCRTSAERPATLWSGSLHATQVSRDKYLQRCAIVSASGEECVLTFTVVLQDSLECQ